MIPHRSLRAAILVAATLLAGSSDATTAPGQRPTDGIFTHDGLVRSLEGRIVEFYDGGQAVFAMDGRYSYSGGALGPPVTGVWQVHNDGLVCLRLDNGTARCDTFVRSADRLVVIDGSGTRIPVRSAVRK